MSATDDVEVTVAVVAFCSARQIAACLDAIHAQEGAPPFETVVAYDPWLPGARELEARYPWVRWFSNEDERTPIQIAATAMGEAKGEYIVLTEDHCVPAPNWVAEMVGNYREGMAAMGGRVEAYPGGGPSDWAFYLVDFFKYGKPIEAGEYPSLTVANVLYRKSYLEQIGETWREGFLEPEVNEALRAKFGKLHIHPPSEVKMNRKVTFYDACRERYAFGRLFGSSRVDHVSPLGRLFYILAAPVLPVLLLVRMCRYGLRSSELFRSYLWCLPALTAMVLTWSWGEWLGYITGSRPADLTVAPELDA